MNKKQNEYTFDDLRFHYSTGRVFTISGSGRNAKKEYRHGVQCNLGNIEESKWCFLMDELIDRSDERELHNQLLEWIEENPWHMAQKELDLEAFRLHSMRMFDCELWADFLPFNYRYRPNALHNIKTCWIMTDCCNLPGEITQAQLDEKYNRNDKGEKITRCPICGRWSTYRIID